jgi:hypothetical protein
MISGTFEEVGEESGVVLIVFHQQDAKRGCRGWRGIDLVWLIWGEHRVVFEE